jgi:hypothetical protein
MQRNSRDCPLRFWVLKVVVVTGVPLPLSMVAREVSWRYLLRSMVLGNCCITPCPNRQRENLPLLGDL